MGGALTQPDADGNQLPVCYMSKSLTQAQRNYPTHDRELYAIVASCERWRPYIQGQQTIVLSDHEPLKHFMTQPTLNKRQARWQEKLADTPITIVYRPGKKAAVPDALSRIPEHA